MVPISATGVTLIGNQSTTQEVLQCANTGAHFIYALSKSDSMAIQHDHALRDTRVQIPSSKQTTLFDPIQESSPRPFDWQLYMLNTKPTRQYYEMIIPRHLYSITMKKTYQLNKLDTSNIRKVEFAFLKRDLRNEQSIGQHFQFIR